MEREAASAEMERLRVEGALLRLEVDRLHGELKRARASGPSSSPMEIDELHLPAMEVDRRTGHTSREGCKPLFEREEIKKVVREVEEQRTVVSLDGEKSVSPSKLRISKRHSLSSSSIRSNNYSSEYLSSYHVRYRNTESKHPVRKVEYTDYHKSDRHNSIEKYKEYKNKYTDRDVRRHDSNRSYSRERDVRISDSKSIIDNRSYRNRYHDRSSERSRERRDRDRSRDRDRDWDRGRDRDRDRDRNRDRSRSRNRRTTVPHYVEHVPVPIYYSNFPPRPIMVSPMITIPRGQIPPLVRGQHPPLMTPVRPFPPRFGPPDMYRIPPSTSNPKSRPPLLPGGDSSDSSALLKWPLSHSQ
ncbi:serine/threonine-protein kinase fray2-like [Odontomachus brunneus]|uniref:serine/threonine-protein kinase fray2-like n=1 Tax=Odontomachus brunneus TaxID=486640 RepID=UPI0013F215FF|nr:serine/threonine-protein kinase fray2-like [Odontomachus brunneus]